MDERILDVTTTERLLPVARAQPGTDLVVVPVVPGKGALAAVPVQSLRIRSRISHALAVLVLRRFGRAALADAWAREADFGHAILFVPVFMGLGALVWFSLAPMPHLAWIAGLLCVSGIAAWRSRARGDVAQAFLGAFFFFAAGIALAAIETARKDTIILDSPVTTSVTGHVLARETDDRARQRYVVAITSTADPKIQRAPSRATLVARGRHEPIDIGEPISGRVRLSPPSGPALPGLNDFGFDAYFRGVGAVGFFYGAPERPADAAPAPTSLLSGVLGWLASLREGIGTRIRATIGGDAGAIAAALVTGEERAIARDTIEALRSAGLSHVLAISGLNMVLAAGTFMVGARSAMALVPGLAHRMPIKKIAAGCALLMVLFYILISGGSVSAVRAWIMISIMLVAVLVDRPSISLRNVALAAVLIVVVTPSAVTSPGFQMSFAATLALVAGYARWRDRPVEMTVAPRSPLWTTFFTIRTFFGGLLLSSLIGGLSTLVYSAGHFHTLAAYGLAGNILAMPIISIVVMPLALVSMMLMPFGLDGYTLPLMGIGIDWMIAVAREVSTWGGEVATGRLPATAVVLIALGTLVACLLRTQLAVFGALLVALGIGVLVVTPADPPSVLIAEDGRLVAILDDDQAAVNRPRPPAFILDQWRRALRIGTVSPPVNIAAPVTHAILPAVAMEKALKQSRDGRFVCAAPEWCAATTASGWRIVTVDEPAFIGAACDSAHVVVVPLMLRIETCRSGALLVTARTLRRTGALELRPGPFEAAPPLPPSIVATGAAGPLDRPWSMHRTYDWRSRLFVAEE